MPTFSVRTVLRWPRSAGQRKRRLYEERITLWKAESLEEAIELAEIEAKVYAGGEPEYLDLLQAFWLSEEFTFPHQGVEVFSLLRESDLEPKAYLATFFDSGFERQSDYSGITKPNPALHRMAARPRAQVIPKPRRGRHR